eukprot:scaffold22583_cov106-Cylindrotheca_fusiformis.AAC.17
MGRKGKKGRRAVQQKMTRPEAKDYQSLQPFDVPCERNCSRTGHGWDEYHRLVQEKAQAFKLHPIHVCNSIFQEMQKRNIRFVTWNSIEKSWIQTPNDRVLQKITRACQYAALKANTTTTTTATIQERRILRNNNNNNNIQQEQDNVLKVARTSRPSRGKTMNMVIGMKTTSSRRWSSPRIQNRGDAATPTTTTTTEKEQEAYYWNKTAITPPPPMHHSIFLPLDASINDGRGKTRLCRVTPVIPSCSTIITGPTIKDRAIVVETPRKQATIPLHNKDQGIQLGSTTTNSSKRLLLWPSKKKKTKKKKRPNGAGDPELLPVFKKPKPASSSRTTSPFHDQTKSPICRTLTPVPCTTAGTGGATSGEQQKTPLLLTNNDKRQLLFVGHHHHHHHSRVVSTEKTSNTITTASKDPTPPFSPIDIPPELSADLKDLLEDYPWPPVLADDDDGTIDPLLLQEDSSQHTTFLDSISQPPPSPPPPPSAGVADKVGVADKAVTAVEVDALHFLPDKDGILGFWKEGHEQPPLIPVPENVKSLHLLPKDSYVGFWNDDEDDDDKENIAPIPLLSNDDDDDDDKESAPPIPLSNHNDKENTPPIPLSNDNDKEYTPPIPLSNDNDKENTPPIPLSNDNDKENTPPIPLSNDIDKENTPPIPLSNDDDKENTPPIPLSENPNTLEFLEEDGIHGIWKEEGEDADGTPPLTPESFSTLPQFLLLENEDILECWNEDEDGSSSILVPVPEHCNSSDADGFSPPY